MKTASCSLSCIMAWLLLCFGLAGFTGCGKKSAVPPEKPIEKPAVAHPGPGTGKEQAQPAQPPEPGPSSVEQLMADALAASEMGEFQDALFFYNQALSEAEIPDRPAIISGIEAVLSQTDSVTIQAFLGIKNLDIPRSLLLYWLGRAHVRESHPGEAMDALNRFVAEFPDHEHAQEARISISDIKQTHFDGTTIGCLLPLSGKYGVFGQRALQGIQLAVQEFSRTYQTTFRTIIKDTASDPKKAAQCVEELAQENVIAILGPLLAVETAGKKAQELEIPLVALTQKQEFPASGDYLFSNFITPQMQVRSLASYIFMELGLQKVAILYPDERYGKRYMELFWDVVDEHNGEVVGVEAYDGKKTDFAGPIKKLTGALYRKSANTRGAQKAVSRRQIDFQALFIPDSPSRLNLLLPQLAYNDARGMVLLGTNLWHQQSLLKGETKYCRNAVITDGYFGSSQNPRTAAFDKNYTQLYGKAPGFLEAISYDTAAILFQAAMDDGVTSRQAMRDALLGERLFEGVTGNTIFDENGAARKQLFLITVKNGRFMEIMR